ncbi:MAG TPA: DUF4416 family protein [Acidobacteriota bacterium]|nr:DUF4416 family protein [Acidobacteriota bacterium]
MTYSSDRLKPSPPAKFFFAIAWNGKGAHVEVEKVLTTEFGALTERSATYCFSEFSPYYDVELGSPVWKYLVSLERFLPADQIVEVKHFAEEVESLFSTGEGDGRRRTVNLDPGYLNGWQVVLSTVKNYTHRISMGRGVFCEVTLIYKEGRFQKLPWTFPDYVSPPVLEFLKKTREGYQT